MALASLALTVFWATVTVAGLGRSALLPLLISLAQLESTGIAASVAGGLICISQVGYGIATFGVGPLENAAGSHLSTV
jgi:FHS family glucose/mannose:H+ symporter-like MFS transporter